MSMKKALLLLLTIVLMFGLLAITVSAAEYSGQCSEGNITWVLDDEGTITFTGTGEIEERFGSDGYAWVQYEWTPYRDQIRRVVIGEGITGVGDDAFYVCKNLTEVVLPESMMFIRDNAFYSCNNLKSIDLPTTNSLYINEYAFARTGLTEIYLPDNVGDVGKYAFTQCKSLTKARLSNNQFEMLREHVFSNCTSLNEIDFGTSINRINDYALYNTGFETLVIPDTITFLGDYALSHCENLTTVDLGRVGSIRKYTFLSCSKLESVTVGPELFFIGWNAFKGCTAIEELYIPDLESWCKMKTEYTESNPMFYAQRAYIGGVLMEDLVLPEHITSFDMYAFEAADCLKSVVINDKITSFRGFSNCPNLTNVVIGSDVREIGDGSFRNCPNLKTVIFRGSAPEVGFPGACFEQSPATCYYPKDDLSWNEDAFYWFADCVTWIPYDRELGVGNPFSDVLWDSFFYEPVLWALENNITTGTSATTFGPTGECLRAHVVTFLWRAAGCPEPTSTENPFVDVKEGDFFHKAVLWAVENGITNGVDATHFGPTVPCNRAQVVTFLYRAMQSPAVGTAACPFTDVVRGEWYEPAVLWAVENGITNGLSADTFGVETTCNRAQVVTFLYRTYVN